MKSTMSHSMVPNGIALTQSEVEALAYKATKGAGLPWGIAEEAAFMASWFHNKGVDILTPLATHLDQIKGHAWADLIDPSGQVSALCFGPSLGEMLGSCQSYDLGEMRDPVFLLPFVDACATVVGRGFSVTVDNQEIALNTQIRACNSVKVTLLDTPKTWPRPVAATYPMATKDHLDQLAFATYVPATEASRAGAGSSQSDND